MATISQQRSNGIRFSSGIDFPPGTGTAAITHIPRQRSPVRRRVFCQQTILSEGRFYKLFYLQAGIVTILSANSKCSISKQVL